MNKKTIIIFILVLVLGAAALLSLGGNIMSPYISFQEAMQSGGSYVQVMGTIDKTQPVTYQGTSMRFILNDGKASTLQISYNGPKPVNFEHATQAVVLGTYDPAGKVFMADKLLLKCPSKYQKERRG